MAACGNDNAPAALPDIGALSCNAAATSSTEGSSLDALPELAARERSPITTRIAHGGHGNGGAEPAIAVAGSDRATLANQLRTASDAACRLRTPDDARRAGYVRSSNYSEGVGTHWINWGLVDAPFDPARPAMLLYAPRQGTTRLVGFSYWVRAPTVEGFAGNADTWHRHSGLCFDPTGMLVRENVWARTQCAGTWLNGSDLWMLHAWIVPGDPNPWGVFASLNPTLCRRNVPDISRCPHLD
jgi:hypothetical protein